MKTVLSICLLMVATSQISESHLMGMCNAPAVVSDNSSSLLVKRIVGKYKVDGKLAAKIVALAAKYEQPVFPKVRDIVAIIGIESNFNPNAVSKLKTDPAIGLTQIRPVAWSHKIKRSELSDMDGQVKHGALILSHYYNVLDGNKAGAISAYNIGLRNYQRGMYPEAANRYLTKYRKEIKTYDKVDHIYGS